MGYGGPIGLIVLGLILMFALNETAVGPLELQTLGLILVVAGGAWLVLTLIQQSGRRSTHTTATTTDTQGRQATTEQRTEMDPPA